MHFHDMFWPFEYPREWAVEENRSWNELYAIRAFLINNKQWKIVMFNDYLVKSEPAMIEKTDEQNIAGCQLLKNAWVDLLNAGREYLDLRCRFA